MVIGVLGAPPPVAPMPPSSPSAANAASGTSGVSSPPAPARPAKPARDESLSAHSALLARDGLRILLAEDHPVNQKVVQLMLGALGIEVITVDDGAAALEAIRNDRFDLVLMDMQMPVMDGLTAIRHIRARERAEGLPPTPILTLTANAQPALMATSLAVVRGAGSHRTFRPSMGSGDNSGRRSLRCRCPGFRRRTTACHLKEGMMRERQGVSAGVFSFLSPFFSVEILFCAEE